jgi:hypothetical protein
MQVRLSRPHCSLLVLLPVLVRLEAANPFRVPESFRNEQSDDVLENTSEDIAEKHALEDNAERNSIEDTADAEGIDNGRAIDNFKDNFNQDPFPNRETKQGVMFK